MTRLFRSEIISTTTLHPDPIHFDDKPVILAAVLFGAIGVAIFPIMPLVIGALIDHLNLEPAQSGFFASADVIGIAAGNGLAFFWVRHVSWRKMAMLAIAVMVAGNLLCMATDQFASMLGLRFVTGLAEGTVLALTYAMLSSTRNPDRNYGLFLLANLGLGAINIFILTWMIGQLGGTAVFVNLAAASLVLVPLIRYVPDHGFAAARAPGDYGAKDAPVRLTPVLIILFANLVYFTGQGSFWAYLERIGLQGGLESTQIAAAISVSIVAGILGALTASWLNVRFGRVLPLALAISAAMLAAILLQWQVVAAIFVAAACMFNFANNYGHPYLLGYLAQIDRSGRYVVFSGAVQTGGMGLGPGIAALAITGVNYSQVLWVPIICFSLTLLLFMPIMIRVRGIDD